jgi:hypothetical protein
MQSDATTMSAAGGQKKFKAGLDEFPYLGQPLRFISISRAIVWLLKRIALKIHMSTGDD